MKNLILLLTIKRKYRRLKQIDPPLKTPCNHRFALALEKSALKIGINRFTLGTRDSRNKQVYIYVCVCVCVWCNALDFLEASDREENFALTFSMLHSHVTAAALRTPPPLVAGIVAQ